MTDKLVQSLFDKAGYKEAKPHLAKVVGIKLVERCECSDDEAEHTEKV